MPSLFEPLQFPSGLVAKNRVRVPLLVAGKIWTRGEAEQLLGLGADAVALGRSAILNPEWPQQAASPGFEPLRPPVTLEQLRALDLSPAFAEYMRRWPGFVV